MTANDGMAIDLRLTFLELQPELLRVSYFLRTLIEAQDDADQRDHRHGDGEGHRSRWGGSSDPGLPNRVARSLYPQKRRGFPGDRELDASGDA